MIFLTPLIFLLVILIPLPFTISYHKLSGRSHGLLAAITPVIFIILFGSLVGLLLGVYASGLGTVYGYLTREKEPAFDVIKFGTIGMVVLFSLFLLGMQYFYDVNLIQGTEEYLAEMVQVQAEQLEEAEVPSSQIQELKEIPNLYSEFIKPLIPSGLIISAVVLSFTHYLAGYKILNSYGKELNQITSFKYWKLPRYISIIFIISILGVLIAGHESSLPGVFFMNLFNLLTYALMVQGASLSYWFLREKKIAKFISVVVIIIIFIIPPLSFILLFAGVFDLAFNFRKV